MNITEKINMYLNESYTFKQLTKFCSISDTNNPNKKEQKKAEMVLRDIGFFDKDGEIPLKLDTKYKTSDGKTLKDLKQWFEENI